jgi:hypothetical protein
VSRSKRHAGSVIENTREQHRSCSSAKPDESSTVCHNDKLFVRTIMQNWRDETRRTMAFVYCSCCGCSRQIAASDYRSPRMAASRRQFQDRQRPVMAASRRESSVIDRAADVDPVRSALASGPGPSRRFLCLARAPSRRSSVTPVAETLLS